MGSSKTCLPTGLMHQQFNLALCNYRLYVWLRSTQVKSLLTQQRMEFHMLRINAGKLLRLILLSSVGGALAVCGLSVLGRHSSFLAAGSATILFFGGGWMFNRCLNATQEPLCVTVCATELMELNERSGQRRRWPFAEIMAYRVVPEVRGTITLHLTLRGGRSARLSASNLRLTTTASNTQFEQMRHAFEVAWHQYKQR